MYGLPYVLFYIGSHPHGQLSQHHLLHGSPLPHWCVKWSLSYRDFPCMYNSVSGLCFLFYWSSYLSLCHSRWFRWFYLYKKSWIWQVWQRPASFSLYLFPPVLETAAELHFTASLAIGVATWVSSSQWCEWKQWTPFPDIAYKNFNAVSFILFPFP